jgi:hypothetical protein
MDAGCQSVGNGSWTTVCGTGARLDAPRSGWSQSLMDDEVSFKSSQTMLSMTIKYRSAQVSGNIQYFVTF